MIDIYSVFKFFKLDDKIPFSRYSYGNHQSQKMVKIFETFYSVENIKYLEKWTENRIKSAKKYDEILDAKRITRTTNDEGRHVYHIYSVLINNRDHVMRELNKKNIAVSSHYPIPCHLQEGYKSLIKLGSTLQVTEHVSSRLLSLPLDENINHEQISYICDELERSIYKNE